MGLVTVFDVLNLRNLGLVSVRDGLERPDDRLGVGRRVEPVAVVP
jgi:hypothetical protein